MKVQNINPNINFNAKFCRRGYEVNKIFNHGTEYKPNGITVIEIDVNNNADLYALYKITTDWQEDTYSVNIYNNALEKLKGISYYKKYRTFAITEQTENFDKLDDKKILALADISEIESLKTAHILHLQVNPNYYYYIKNRNIKGIGTSFLNYFKDMYNRITLCSTTSWGVKEFYRKNDFIEYPNHSCNFSWTRDIFSMLGINK